MLIRIISLVFLLTFINYDFLLSGENNKFIFPKDKPSIFKKVDQKRIEERNKAFQIPREKPKENAWCLKPYSKPSFFPKQ